MTKKIRLLECYAASLGQFPDVSEQSRQTLTQRHIYEDLNPSQS